MPSAFKYYLKMKYHLSTVERKKINNWFRYILLNVKMPYFFIIIILLNEDEVSFMNWVKKKEKILEHVQYIIHFKKILFLKVFKLGR